jgi:hypothetical protein
MHTYQKQQSTVNGSFAVKVFSSNKSSLGKYQSLKEVRFTRGQ